MKIFLVRHADAVEERARMGDEARWLTLEGRRVARAVARRLKEEGVALDFVLTSPLVRAVQTAELLADGLDYTGVVEVLGPLSPGIPPRLAGEAVAALGGEAIALVGHEPGMSALGAFLVGRPSFPPFRKGQVSLIEDGRPGWLLRPDTLVKEPLLVA